MASLLILPQIARKHPSSVSLTHMRGVVGSVVIVFNLGTINPSGVVGCHIAESRSLKEMWYSGGCMSGYSGVVYRILLYRDKKKRALLLFFCPIDYQLYLPTGLATGIGAFATALMMVAMVWLALPARLARYASSAG